VNDVMNVDELRGAIWDYLFRARETRTIEQIASVAEQDPTVIRAAVEHQWFTVADGSVSIAYAEPS